MNATAVLDQMAARKDLLSTLTQTSNQHCASACIMRSSSAYCHFKPVIRTVQDKVRMRPYANGVWRILQECYANIEGGLNYSSIQQLIDTSAFWDVSMVNGQVLAATVFKAKRGLKLVAMAVNRQVGEEAKHALKRMILSRLDHCWMELSGAAERFVVRNCDGASYYLDASRAGSLLDTAIQPSADGFHYRRFILGIEKEKIALGTPDAIFFVKSDTPKHIKLDEEVKKIAA